MTPERFKGSEAELKFDDAAKPLFDLMNFHLNGFYKDGFEANPWLLQLYDEKRIPFSDRIKKNAFVEFIKELFRRYGFVGNLETNLFVMRAIFGAESEIFFEIPEPGVLNVDINATSSLEFNFIGQEVGGDPFSVTDSVGDDLIFRGLSGIETNAELVLLFAEIMPAGITTNISLTFFTRYFWVAEEDDVLYNMVDHEENDIVFVEVGS